MTVLNDYIQVELLPEPKTKIITNRPIMKLARGRIIQVGIGIAPNNEVLHAGDGRLKFEPTTLEPGMIVAFPQGVARTIDGVTFIQEVNVEMVLADENVVVG